jgi:hypothetical protein
MHGGLRPETRNATPWSGVSELSDRSPSTGHWPPDKWPEFVLLAFCSFSGWLFPFQGRSLASALAGSAFLYAGWYEPAQRYITGAFDVAIELPFRNCLVFNELIGSGVFGFSH